LTIAIGLVLGFLSGLFGVGGSSIATPILRLLGVPSLIALATPLPVTLPIALAGGAAYWRRGCVSPRVAFWTAGGGVPAVIAGSYVSAYVPARALMVATGLVVLGAGWRLLAERDLEAARPRATVAVPMLLLVGAGVGFLSGLLANGGGFLLLPAFLLLFHLEPAVAAATSLVSVALLALPATLVHWKLGHIDPGLALVLAAAMAPSTFIGAYVGSRLHPQLARRLFSWFLVLFGAFVLLRTLYRIEVLGWS
jgi:uncharacterized membrane protein YfcA